jgi:hypothetical protein
MATKADKIHNILKSMEPPEFVNPKHQAVLRGQLNEMVANKMLQEAKAGHAPAQAREGRRMKAWKPALAAGIAGLLACGALLWLKFHSAGDAFAKMPAFSLFREACAAEESLFKGEGIVSIVNEFIVKPISDPAMAHVRRYWLNSLAPSGKLRYDMLRLPANPREGYIVEDRSWYDQKSGRFARVMTVGHKAIFANSFDGKDVYLLEPDAAGALIVVSKPVAADFRPPRNPAEFMGITAGLGRSGAFVEKKSNLISDAGEVTLPDGSAARVVKINTDTTGMTGKEMKDMKERMGDSYSLITIRKTDNTIAQVETVIKGQSYLVIRRLAVAPASASEVPWNLVGIEAQPASAQTPSTPSVNRIPKIEPDDKKTRTNVSVQQMAEKAGYEAYIFAADPPWTVERHIDEIHDPILLPALGYMTTYCARDGRHVVFAQENNLPAPFVEGPLAEKLKLTVVYTSPNGLKVWNLPKRMAPGLLQAARTWTKDVPLADSAGYLIKTPAGTFPMLAVNGALSDDELHALIDSLIPAKEYLKKFPAPAATGAEKAGTTSP